MSLKRALMYNAPAYLGYTIAAVLIGAATAIIWPLLAWWWPLADVANPMLEGFLRGALGILTYILWGITLLAVLGLVRNLTRLSVPEGRFPLRSWVMTRFFIYNLLVMIARYTFLSVTRTTRINVAFYRLMGAKIGKGVVINSPQIYDLNLLTLGDKVTIGGSAVVMAHAGQGDQMYMAPVVIEDGASIGEAAIVFPGARIGAGAVIGAGSVVPRDAEIPPGTKWSGVPIQQIDGKDA